MAQDGWGSMLMEAADHAGQVVMDVMEGIGEQLSGLLGLIGLGGSAVAARTTASRSSAPARSAPATTVAAPATPSVQRSPDTIISQSAELFKDRPELREAAAPAVASLAALGAALQNITSSVQDYSAVDLSYLSPPAIGAAAPALGKGSGMWVG